MKILSKTVYRVAGMTGRISDWFLIGIGLVLIAKSIFTVDVFPAKLVIGGLGVIFSGAGFWYRYRRKRSAAGRDE